MGVLRNKPVAWWRVFFITMVGLIFLLQTVALGFLVVGHNNTAAEISQQTTENTKLANAGTQQLKFAGWIVEVNTSVCQYIAHTDPNGPQCPPLPINLSKKK